jgi:hypothetical protein
MRTRLPLPLLLSLAACHSDSDSGSAPQPTPVVTNRGLAAVRLYGAGGLRLVSASEADQGVDLDGDGDLGDLVMHVLDLETGAFSNTGLALPPTTPRDEVPPPEFGCSEALGVFQVSEAATGQDLDDDGVPDDVASWSFNRRTGLLAALPFAHGDVALGGDLAAFLAATAGGETALHVLDGRDGSLTTRALVPSGLLGIDGTTVAFTLAELGAADLNADGDADDFSVLHLYDADSLHVVNKSLDVIQNELRFAGGFVGFLASEPANGGLDLDGDGDALDSVFVAIDESTGLTRIPGVSGSSPFDLPGAASDLFLMRVPEQGLDRNGDGDGSDAVAVAYDARTDELFESGLAMPNSFLVESDGWLGVPVSEADQGPTDLDGDGRFGVLPFAFDTASGASVRLGYPGFFVGTLEGHLLGVASEEGGDLNGDGDLADFVLQSWSTRTRRNTNTGVAFGALFGSAGERALVAVVEAGQGADLNGDGDTLDMVLALLDAKSGHVQSLELAITSGDAALGAAGFGAALVNEAAQGADLNGDGDLDDDVLHEIELRGNGAAD